MKIGIFNKPENISVRGQVIFLFIISLIIRLVTVIVFVQTRGVYLYADASEYIQYARCILDQGWMVKNADALNGSLIGPGYPFLVALNFLISGPDHFWFLFIVQSIFGSLTVVIIYKLALFLSNEKGIALICGIWLSFYFQYIWYTPWVLKETVVFLFFPLSVYLVILLRRSVKPFGKENILFILTFSYLIHSDERYFFFLPFLLLFILVPFNQLRKRFITSIVTLIGIVLCMTPWLYRNYKVIGRPVILTERTTIFTDKLFGYKNNVSFSIRVNSKTGIKRIHPNGEESVPVYEAIVDSLRAGNIVLSTEDQVLGVDAIKKAFSSGVIPYHFGSVKRRWTYFSEYWRPVKFKGSFYGYGYRYADAWKLRMNLISLLQYGLLLPFFIFGIYQILRKKQIDSIFIIFIILAHCFIHVFLAWGSRRYRLPIDGFIIIIAFWGAFILYEKLKLKYFNKAAI